MSAGRRHRARASRGARTAGRRAAGSSRCRSRTRRACRPRVFRRRGSRAVPRPCGRTARRCPSSGPRARCRSSTSSARRAPAADRGDRGAASGHTRRRTACPHRGTAAQTRRPAPSSCGRWRAPRRRVAVPSSSPRRSPRVGNHPATTCPSGGSCNRAGRGAWGAWARSRDGGSSARGRPRMRPCRPASCEGRLNRGGRCRRSGARAGSGR